LPELACCSVIIEGSEVLNQNLAVHEANSGNPPSADDIGAELERILASPDLQASARRRDFLRYVVEETLSGRADRLKGFSIAVSVFGRDETFDAQTDPVVRLEARRLRRDLDCYYVDAGNQNPLRISIPKGSYVPNFEWQEVNRRAPGRGEADAPAADEQSEKSQPRSFGALAAGGFARSRNSGVFALIVLVAAIATFSWYMTGQKAPAAVSGGPGIAVLPFESLGSSENGQYIAAGISQDLVGELMRFPGFRLYLPPRDSEMTAEMPQTNTGTEAGVSYVVRGSVREDKNQVRVWAQVSTVETGQVLWAETFDRPLQPEALIKLQSELTAEIATALGQPYSAVNSDFSRRAEMQAVASMQSYVCVQRAYGYRRSFSRAQFGPVLQCLQETIRRDPGYSDAWAMLGWLYLDAGRYEFDGADAVQANYEKAFQAASRATSLAPDDALGLKALSSINHYMGHFDEGDRLARQAAKLNPNDPDTLAQLGWRLAVRGNFDEGIPILKRAIERTVNPPGWYFHLVAIDLYLKGDYRRMREVAERSAIDGSAFSQALIAIASGALSDRETAQAALGKLPVSGPLARGVDDFLIRHGATDEIVRAFEAGLQRAHQVAAGA
jgi:TolB-like protein/Tfp pilus assembly protein PilF